MNEPVAPEKLPYSGLAITSLVLISVSFLFTIFTAIPAVICAHLELSRQKKQPGVHNLAGKGMAIAALIIGYELIAIFALYITIVIIALTMRH